MGRRRQYHDTTLPAKLKRYADDHMLDFAQYSQYHLRLMDGGLTVLDIWTSGKYYIVATDYLQMCGEGTIERAGEKGNVPSNDMLKLAAWLDKIFFPLDVM